MKLANIALWAVECSEVWYEKYQSGEDGGVEKRAPFVLLHCGLCISKVPRGTLEKHVCVVFVLVSQCSLER